MRGLRHVAQKGAHFGNRISDISTLVTLPLRRSLQAVDICDYVVGDSSATLRGHETTRAKYTTKFRSDGAYKIWCAEIYRRIGAAIDNLTQRPL